MAETESLNRLVQGVTGEKNRLKRPEEMKCGRSAEKNFPTYSQPSQTEH